MKSFYSHKIVDLANLGLHIDNHKKGEKRFLGIYPKKMLSFNIIYNSKKVNNIWISKIVKAFYK